MKIAVAGAGHVGMSIAVLLAQRHDVVAVDVDASRVDLINRGRSPVEDPEITAFLTHADLRLSATVDPAAYADADVVVVATPVPYDPATHYLDTTTVEAVTSEVLAANPHATVVIRSTVPIGFTAGLRERHPGATIMFSPEFLREGRGLLDNLRPSRVVVGSTTAEGKVVAELLAEAAAPAEVPVLLTGSTEAEAIKLFANTYLALRLAYVNELDTYAAMHGLDTGQIIAGMGLDPLIGQRDVNPSFGYDGPYLPKDAEQLETSYAGVPQNLISAVVDANATRKDFIADDVLRAKPKTVGIFHLGSGGAAGQATSLQEVAQRLQAAGVEVLVHEPEAEGRLVGSELVADLDAFKRRAEVILTDRRSDLLSDVVDKIYTRDISGHGRP